MRIGFAKHFTMSPDFGGGHDKRTRVFLFDEKGLMASSFVANRFFLVHVDLSLFRKFLIGFVFPLGPPPFGAGGLTQMQKGKDVDPGQRQYEFTDEDKKRFREDPEFHLQFRKGIEAEINGKLRLELAAINAADRSQVFSACIDKALIYRTLSGKSLPKR